MANPGQVGYGPLVSVDGPLPLRPPYGLVQAAEAAVGEVRLIVDADPTPHWINGAEVYGYPADDPTVWDACATTAGTKPYGSPPSLPTFGAMEVVVPVSCSTFSVASDPTAFRARALTVLDAVEGAAVEREFMTGEVLGLRGSRYLADSYCQVLNGGGATSPSNALAILEAKIARSKRRGVIHCSPALATAFAGTFDFSEVQTGVVRTKIGTLVVVGAGYQSDVINHDIIEPPGAAGPGNQQEWAFVTGPIDVRRSQPEVIPGTFSEALDHLANYATYRAERYYLVTWDTELQAAVLVDRCRSTC